METQARLILMKMMYRYRFYERRDEMKKIVFTMVLATMMIVSCVANASLLDESRWQWLTANDECGYYVDKTSIKILPDKSFFAALTCCYYPSRNQYVMIHTLVDAKYNKFAEEGFVVFDEDGHFFSGFSVKNPKPIDIKPHMLIARLKDYVIKNNRGIKR